MLRRLVGRVARIGHMALTLALAGAGCTSAPRPVPVSGQPVANAEAAGIVLTVPRLDYGSYPDDVLDVSAAVFVAIENRGTVEIQISPEDFWLGPRSGVGESPVAPAQLSLRPGRHEPQDRAATAEEPGGRALLDDGSAALAGPVMLARMGGGGGRGGGHGGHIGGGSFRSAPSYRGGGSFHPAPSYRGGGYRGGSWGGGYRGGYRGGSWGGYRGYRGWYGGPGVYSYWNPWWAYGPYYPYWSGRTYADSREDAQRFALPSGRLAAGGRTAGFLYFPRSTAPEGGQVLLRWQVRDAATRNPVADIEVPLEISAE